MKKNISWLKSLLFLVLYIGVNSSHAGWVIDHVSGDVIYVSSGKLKDVSAEDGAWSIYDSKSGKISMINAAKKTYWQGTAKKFCTTLKQMIPDMEVGLDKPKISIKKTGSEVIAGLATHKYEVKTNGQLHEEVWITENKELAKEMKALHQYIKEIFECRSAQTIEEMVDRDPGYNKIVGRGYVMKQVIYESGMPADSDEVVNVKQKSIPISEFEVPAGYRRVQTLMEIWM